MEWLFDPTAWLGLGTLILLELVLGIDNLVFIAILAQKLPPHQRDKARKIGLIMTLAMRLAMLCSVAWLATLTEPLLDIAGKVFSGRDLVLLLGGLFLLFKATSEIHERLEGKGHGGEQGRYKARFWMVVTQIAILNAVFSIDAVITAVGMSDHLAIMMLAITIAIFLMIAVSRPLTDFVNEHPTIVMLCLGLLLMIGFSLVAEGFGAHIPKGYLYAAIGFSILIEFFNQFAQARLKKRVSKAPDMRERAADTILKILGARKDDSGQSNHEIGALLQLAAKQDLLSAAEKELLRGVFNLIGRRVSTIMTPRTDIEWLDVSEPDEEIRRQIADSKRSQLLVGDGSLENTLGVIDREDFLAPLIHENRMPPLAQMMKEPIFVHENVPILNLLETFKKKISDIAVVIDEFGGVQGVITHHDFLEAIAGEFPDYDDPKPENDILEQPDGSYVINGLTSIYDVRDRTGFEYIPDGKFATMAGFILHEFAHLPMTGETLTWGDWAIEILSLDGKRIGTVKIQRQAVE